MPQLPGPIPVTTPVTAFTVTTPGHEHDQTPPVGVPTKVIVPPVVTVVGPDITGVGLIVTLLIVRPMPGT
jgi:hypothetical protein